MSEKKFRHYSDEITEHQKQETLERMTAFDALRMNKTCVSTYMNSAQSPLLHGGQSNIPGGVSPVTQTFHTRKHPLQSESSSSAFQPSSAAIATTESFLNGNTDMNMTFDSNGTSNMNINTDGNLCKMSNRFEKFLDPTAIYQRLMLYKKTDDILRQQSRAIRNGNDADNGGSPNHGNEQVSSHDRKPYSAIYDPYIGMLSNNEIEMPSFPIEDRVVSKFRKTGRNRKQVRISYASDSSVSSSMVSKSSADSYTTSLFFSNDDKTLSDTNRHKKVTKSKDFIFETKTLLSKKRVKSCGYDGDLIQPIAETKTTAKSSSEKRNFRSRIKLLTEIYNTERMKNPAAVTGDDSMLYTSKYALYKFPESSSSASFALCNSSTASETCSTKPLSLNHKLLRSNQAIFQKTDSVKSHRFDRLLKELDSGILGIPAEIFQSVDFSAEHIDRYFATHPHQTLCSDVFPSSLNDLPADSVIYNAFELIETYKSVIEPESECRPSPATQNMNTTGEKSWLQREQHLKIKIYTRLLQQIGVNVPIVKSSVLLSHESFPPLNELFPTIYRSFSNYITGNNSTLSLIPFDNFIQSYEIRDFFLSFVVQLFHSNSK